MSVVAAISTPLAVGGLALIRICGEGSIQLADKIFSPYAKKLPSQMAGHTCAYGRIVRDGQTLDDVVLTVFRAPHSYTGLDTVEISCHGGVYVAKEILRLILDNGAEPAEPGEFTKLAFLNGKMSLTQAESVMDIICASGEATLKSARLIKDGALYQSIRDISDRLTAALGSLAAWTDYPDEDLPGTDPGSVREAVEFALQRISQILDDYDRGRILREGIDTAIIGKPNVGKSTLMNRLLGYRRSIVTTAAGTTRDVIEEELRLGELRLRLSDTAGIRDAADEAEAMGVDLARKKLDEAELVIAVFDGSEPLSETDRDILERIKDRRHIIVINKSDLPEKIDLKYINDDNILFVSANTGDGVEKIREKLIEMFKLGGLGEGSHLFANERQRSLCVKAKSFLTQALSAIDGGFTLDAVTVCIDSALNELLAISGERATEAVVNDVFSRFCVGK